MMLAFRPPYRTRNRADMTGGIAGAASHELPITPPSAQRAETG